MIFILTTPIGELIIVFQLGTLAEYHTPYMVKSNGLLRHSFLTGLCLSK